MVSKSRSVANRRTLTLGIYPSQIWLGRKQPFYVSFQLIDADRLDEVRLRASIHSVSDVRFTF